MASWVFNTLSDFGVLPIELYRACARSSLVRACRDEVYNGGVWKYGCQKYWVDLVLMQLWIDGEKGGED